jgi:hypothetical protein
MKVVVSGQWSVVSLCGRMSCLLLTAYCLVACSIPNIAPPECDQARVAVREFYSFHFGNDQSFNADDLERRRVYLTERFFENLKTAPPAVDPFTRTDDVPKAFRAGECRVIDPGRRVVFELVLFWKTDTRTDQRAISVEAEKIGDKWLVDSVSNR